MLSVCSCVQRRVVKGSLVVSAGCVVHVEVLGSELCCGWLVEYNRAKRAPGTLWL